MLFGSRTNCIRFHLMMFSDHAHVLIISGKKINWKPVETRKSKLNLRLERVTMIIEKLPTTASTHTLVPYGHTKIQASMQSRPQPTPPTIDLPAFHKLRPN